MLLITNLIIDFSDLREMRDSGEITQAEYQERKDALRNTFREDEQRQFEQQLTEQIQYLQNQ